MNQSASFGISFVAAFVFALLGFLCILGLLAGVGVLRRRRVTAEGRGSGRFFSLGVFAIGIPLFLLLAVAILLPIRVVRTNSLRVQVAEQEAAEREAATREVARRMQAPESFTVEAGPERPAGRVAESGSDDLKAYFKLDVIAGSDPAAPAWVRDAAGSSPWTQEVLGGDRRDGRQPGPAEQLVGYSRDPEPSRELAQAAARRSAVEQLVTYTLWQAQIPDTTQAARMRQRLGAVEGVLRSLFETEFRRWMKEWYTQELSYRQATVYRAAVLVNARVRDVRAYLDQALQLLEQQRFGERQERLARAGLLIGAALAILTAYSALNATTRGHFTGWLRFGALVILVAVCVLLLS